MQTINLKQYYPFCTEDIFVEVSHGPTLIDNNIFLSYHSIRLSTQGVAMVHNLIAGSFTWVGGGTDNGGHRFPTTRYTPYHVPHRTEVAGFMSILHGDDRFYNNVFVKRPDRQDLIDFGKTSEDPRMYETICGTKPFDGYPDPETYFAQFSKMTTQDRSYRDLYYDHLPVYTGGNVFFNGAKPCDTEKNFVEDTEHEVKLELREQDGRYYVDTNLCEYLPAMETPFVSTELLGEAFEPEQRFENPDGTPIFFDRDYFGAPRGIHPVPGPFEKKGEEPVY